MSDSDSDFCTTELRVTKVNDASLRADAAYVLYWMTATRRASYNFGLDRAIGYAAELDKPLIVLEALRCDYQWASDRFHAFLLAGMADNKAAFKSSPICYYPYVESETGAGSGLLAALAEDACVVITDDFPCFFHPRMTAAAAAKTSVLMEAIDSNGLLPMRAAGDRVFTRAFDFRRWLQKNLQQHLAAKPNHQPLAGLKIPAASIPDAITSRWPIASSAMLAASAELLAKLPIDHSVAAVEGVRGGSESGRKRLLAFLADGMDRYNEDRNHPDRDGASGLSPWLHFGHVSAHDIFVELARSEKWSTAQIGSQTSGSREGFWGMSPSAEAFLDQFVTWRELGFNLTSRREDYDHFESLPGWAQTTLSEHETDLRSYLYSFEQLDEAKTHDEIWNAAQRQLRREGKMHNYLRMLWGKKVLEWSPSPQVALQVLIELNNRYALDGRDPNSYSGIFWVFGRYDRAWGPERSIFGKIRFMTSDSTRRKLRLKKYLDRFAGTSQQSLWTEEGSES